MDDRLHRRTIDLGIRLMGVGLCGVAWFALRVLLEHRQGLGLGPAAFALAGVGFLGASVGALCLALGRHALDRIETSARWRPPATAARTVDEMDARAPS